MKTVVLKFGGTSVGSIDRIKKVCKIIASYKKKKFRVIVVSSAMSGVTNELIKKATKISKNFPDSERDEWRVEAEFIGAIRGEEQIRLTTFEDGVKYMEFTEAVHLSSQQRATVFLPL